MSKSDGNFFTIDELLNTTNFGGRKWPGEVLRLAMLMTHYRQPVDFTVRTLEEAERRLDQWYSYLPDHVGNPTESPDEVILADIKDDLNLHMAFANLHQLFTEDLARQHGLASEQNSDIHHFDQDKQVAWATARFLGLMRLSKKEWFGAKVEASGVNADSIELKINERLAFLAAKDFTNADRIRDELLEQGIQLKDSKDPATGERVTTWEVKR